MPSVTTIASSTTSPIATASPPSDMRFSVTPNHRITANVPSSVSGTGSAAIEAGAPVAQRERDHDAATARCRSGSRRARSPSIRRRASPGRRPASSSTSGGSACCARSFGDARLRSRRRRPACSRRAAAPPRSRRPRRAGRDDDVRILGAVDDLGDRRQRDRAGGPLRDRDARAARRGRSPARRARPAASGARRTRGRPRSR